MNKTYTSHPGFGLPIYTQEFDNRQGLRWILSAPGVTAALSVISPTSCNETRQRNRSSPVAQKLAGSGFGRVSGRGRSGLGETRARMARTWGNAAQASSPRRRHRRSAEGRERRPDRRLPYCRPPNVEPGPVSRPAAGSAVSARIGQLSQGLALRRWSAGDGRLDVLRVLAHEGQAARATGSTGRSMAWLVRSLSSGLAWHGLSASA